MFYCHMYKGLTLTQHSFGVVIQDSLQSVSIHCAFYNETLNLELLSVDTGKSHPGFHWTFVVIYAANTGIYNT